MEPSLESLPNLLDHIKELLRSPIFNIGKTDTISHDCQVLVNKIQVLVEEFTECHDPIPTQLLFEYVSTQLSVPTSVFSSLDTGTLIKTTPLLQQILVPIIAYWLQKQQITKNTTILDNLIHYEDNSIMKCICELQVQDKDKDKDREKDKDKDRDYSICQDDCSGNCQFCYRCGRVYHCKCFRIFGLWNGLYQCPECFLGFCRPDREVVGVLFKSYLQPPQENTTTISCIQVDWPLDLYCSNNYSIQLRSFRISPEYQHSWPQHCNIYLDNDLSINYSPLPTHSPLKRRNDSPLTISIQSLAVSDRIKIEQIYAGVQACHFVMVVVVQNRREKEIFQYYFRDQYFCIGEKQSGKYLSELFWGGNSGLSINQLRISGICQYYRDKIKYPCRSKHCRTHYQPFDLYNFICSSVTAKNSVKCWKCPICGVRAYDIVRDLYLEKKMSDTQNKNKIELAFVCNQQDQGKEGAKCFG